MTLQEKKFKQKKKKKGIEGNMEERFTSIDFIIHHIIIFIVEVHFG